MYENESSTRSGAVVVARQVLDHMIYDIVEQEQQRRTTEQLVQAFQWAHWTDWTRTTRAHQEPAARQEVHPLTAVLYDRQRALNSLASHARNNHQNQNFTPQSNTLIRHVRTHRVHSPISASSFASHRRTIASNPHPSTPTQPPSPSSHDQVTIPITHTNNTTSGALIIRRNRNRNDAVTLLLHLRALVPASQAPTLLSPPMKWSWGQERGTSAVRTLQRR